MLPPLLLQPVKSCDMSQACMCMPSKMSASYMPPTLTDDAIYFSSIPVFLAPVPGDTLPFVANDWREDPSSLPAALARFSLIPDPDGGLPLFHPALPALDFLHRPDSSSSSSSSSSAAAAAELPLHLRQPLLKVPEPLAAPPPHMIQGFASGVRSALIKLDGQWSHPLIHPFQAAPESHNHAHFTGIALKAAATTATASSSRTSGRTSPSTATHHACSSFAKFAAQRSRTLRHANWSCLGALQQLWRRWMLLGPTRPLP
jgi:hypothetical protein